VSGGWWFTISAERFLKPEINREVLRPHPGTKQVNTLQHSCYKLTVTSNQTNRLWTEKTAN